MCWNSTSIYTFVQPFCQRLLYLNGGISNHFLLKFHSLVDKNNYIDLLLIILSPAPTAPVFFPRVHEARPDRTNSEMGMKWNFLERLTMVLPGGRCCCWTHKSTTLPFGISSFKHTVGLLCVATTNVRRRRRRNMMMVEPVKRRHGKRGECADHQKAGEWDSRMRCCVEPPSMTAAFCDHCRRSHRVGFLVEAEVQR